MSRTHSRDFRETQSSGCLRPCCAEVAKVRDDVSEAALAHKIPDKVRAAYLRTRFLDERRKLMQDWAGYVAGEDKKAVGAQPLDGQALLVLTSKLEHPNNCG